MGFERGVDKIEVGDSEPDTAVLDETEIWQK